MLLQNPLQKYKILIVDDDQRLSGVLKMMLGKMGFSDIELTRSGIDAASRLKDTAYDLLITEWNTQHLSGLDLIQRIRHDSESKNPSLPVIMLTGRAEVSDVEAARDIGVNEYVVKPFSAKTVYDRLEHVIEKPRPFVISKNFIGPCRRHHGNPPAGLPDRRKTKLTPRHSSDSSFVRAMNDTAPHLWMPDFSLKQKLGAGVALPSLITPEVLDKAQTSIEAITDESLAWIKHDMNDIRLLWAQAQQSQNPVGMVKQISDTALTIHSRAGVFGYKQASQVANMLYMFCRIRFNTADPTHFTVIQKHIEVLQVVLANSMRGRTSDTVAPIIQELQKLSEKYAG